MALASPSHLDVDPLSVFPIGKVAAMLPAGWLLALDKGQ
jgi:hypothetical protein